MPVDRLEVRVSITKLLLALVIVIVPLSVIGLVLTGRSDRALDRSMGSNFQAIAATYSNNVSQFVTDRVAEVTAIASDPTVIAAVSSGRRTPAKSPSGTAATATGSAAKAGARTTGASTGSSSADELLRRQKASDARLLGLVLTDENGDVVAASGQPPRTSYSQDENWQAAFNNGNGAVRISEIVNDEFTKSDYVTVGVPVVDTAAGRTMGVLSAAVSLSEILAPFQQAQIGSGAKAILVNDDGTVISGPNTDVFARVKSTEFDAIRDALGPVQGRQSGFQMADVRGGPYLIAFSGTGLKQHYPNLGWTVLVSAEEHLAAAPVRSLEHFALIMVILALFMLTLLCVYYYLHRTQRFAGIEAAVPASSNDRAAAASM
ncbi:MAG: cache domain-containing protein [Acidobacteriaceae bacterium]|nr:cache domain-containing protein [Acidobacteriaceae bacterium]